MCTIQEIDQSSKDTLKDSVVLFNLKLHIMVLEGFPRRNLPFSATSHQKLLKSDISHPSGSSENPKFDMIKIPAFSGSSVEKAMFYIVESSLWFPSS